MLVPTDFSADSARAAESALRLAKPFGASIHLLHCHPVYAGVAALYGLAVPADLETSVREVARSQLEEWRAKLAAEADASPVEVHLSSEAPAAAIVSLARELGADLIVMGTRGRSGLEHLWAGSVAERVVREAPCGVLTVRARNQPGQAG